MNTPTSNGRLDYLDAVRAFALLLGIVFHACLSFMPIYIGWAVMDVSTSPIIPGFSLISHSFRMELFFLIAGFFSHMTFHKRGSGSFLKSRFTRIAIPFVIAWFILRPLVVSGWIMGGESLRGDVNILNGLTQGFQTLQTLPAGIFTGTHLWFLYYLLLVTASTLLLSRLLAFTPSLKQSLANVADKSIHLLSRSSSSAAILAIPTAACLYFMSNWGMDTPDKSLVPHLPTYLVYLGCFTLGWMIHRQPQLLDALSRLTPVRILNIIGAALFTLYLSGYQSDPGREYYQQFHIAFTFSYGVLMWSLVFGCIGLFRLIFNRPNRAVRYIADASYWLYLVHLPIVVWLQTAVAELPFNWSLKLAAVSIITIGISLLVYDIAIRPTFIGKILNGSKKSSFLFSITKRKNIEQNGNSKPVSL